MCNSKDVKENCFKNQKEQKTLQGLEKLRSPSNNYRKWQQQYMPIKLEYSVKKFTHPLFGYNESDKVKFIHGGTQTRAVVNSLRTYFHVI